MFWPTRVARSVAIHPHTGVELNRPVVFEPEHLDRHRAFRIRPGIDGINLDTGLLIEQVSNVGDDRNRRNVEQRRLNFLPAVDGPNDVGIHGVVAPDDVTVPGDPRQRVALWFGRLIGNVGNEKVSLGIDIRGTLTVFKCRDPEGGSG